MSLPPRSLVSRPYLLYTLQSRIAGSVGRQREVRDLAFAIHIQRARRAVYFHFCPASGRALQRPTRFFLARRRAFRVFRPAQSARSSINPQTGQSLPRGRGRLCDAARSSAYFYAFVINPHTLTHTHRGHNARVHQPPARAPAKTAWSVHTTSARGGPCLPARCGDAHRRLDRLGQAGVLLL